MQTINKNLVNKMDYDRYVYLKKNKGKIKEEKFKMLVLYFTEGKEIPYPKYKDKKKIKAKLRELSD